MIRRAYQNPRLMILAVTLIAVSGIAGFSTRSTREDPESQVRWGYVTTQLPGAEPLEVESLVTEPIEQTLREAGTVASIESSSLRGVSLVFIRLTDEVNDVGRSWTRIQDQLSEVVGQLPPRASVPILVDDRRWGSHSTVIALHEQSKRPVEPGVLARWGRELDNRLSFIKGTRFTETFGIPAEEVLVELDEETIAATRLTIQEVSERIRARDSEGLDATAQAGGHTMPVSLSGDVDSLDWLRHLLFRGDTENRQLQLGDVASIRRGEREPRAESAYVRGRRAVVVATRMDEAYSIDAWTKRQQDVLDEFKQALPAELGITILFNQKKYTDERAANLYASLALGMLLVIVVVCLVMGWRAAIPVCCALPLTMGVVFFLMIPFGISLHQMSIAGLILALGMLIDNPIIVVDDIQRRLDSGAPAVQAIQQSIRRLTTPLVGSNVTTILGFLPILLIGGPVGEFMEQLGWSVITCLIGSLLLSLTIIPILAAWCLRPARGIVPVDPPPVEGETPIARGYRRFLEVVLRYPSLLIAFSMTVPLVGFGVAGSLQEQFFPIAERDHFYFTVRLPAHASVAETEQVALRAREIAIAHPEVQEVALFVGRSAPKLHYSMVALEDNRPNVAQALVQLNTPTVSLDLIHQIQRELNEQLRQAQCVVTLIEQGPPAPAPIELRIYGSSLAHLFDLGQQAQRLLMQVPGVIHTRSSLDPGGPLFGLDIQQNEVENSGLVDEVISRQIRDCLDGQVATTLSEEMEEVPIRVRLANNQVNDPERVLSLPLVTADPDPRIMSLESVANWTVDQQIFSLYRRNSTRCNIVYAYVQSGELPIVIEEEFKALMRKQGFEMPIGYRYDFGGISAERNAAVGNLLAYLSIIIVLMAAVLVLTLGSFRMAGIICVVAVLSVGLGLFSLWLFAFPIGIFAIVGIAGMMGLAVNDSIVVLNECQLGEQHSLTIDQCVAQSTRHVLATSVTTVAGVLPLILRGGDFFPPMMVVIAGGILGATLIALGFTPAYYSLLKPARN